MVECTSGVAAPVVDTVLGSILMLGTATGHGKPDRAVLSVPAACQTKLASCLGSKEATMATSWAWPDGFALAISLDATSTGLELVRDHRSAKPPSEPK
jgi:hypothetical protein